MDVMGATQVDLSSAIGRQMAVQQDNVISITFHLAFKVLRYLNLYDILVCTLV